MRGEKAFRWSLVVLWMSLIFWFSHQPASISSEMSRGVLGKLIGVLQLVVPVLDAYTDVLHTLVRKIAHFSIYFILGALVLNALYDRKGVTAKVMLMTLAICCLYAMSDEYHQTFISGRSGEMRDVMIDSTGAFFGSLSYGKISRL